MTVDLLALQRRFDWPSSRWRMLLWFEPHEHQVVDRIVRDMLALVPELHFRIVEHDERQREVAVMTAGGWRRVAR